MLHGVPTVAPQAIIPHVSYSPSFLLAPMFSGAARAAYARFVLSGVSVDDRYYVASPVRSEYRYSAR